MDRKRNAKERVLADAALQLSQHVHQHYPQAVVSMLEIPYTDEDLTIEVALPQGTALRKVSDDLIRTCLTIEDELGVSILTQVTHSAAAEATTRG